jgi:hypothetical protein
MANSTATPSSSIQSMPVRIHDAWRLARMYAPSHSKTILSMPPVNFYASEPNTEGTIHFLEFDGTNWNAFDKGPALGFQPRLHFMLDSMEIDKARSIHNYTNLVASVAL